MVQADLGRQAAKVNTDRDLLFLSSNSRVSRGSEEARFIFQTRVTGGKGGKSMWPWIMSPRPSWPQSSQRQHHLLVVEESLSSDRTRREKVYIELASKE